MNEEARETLVKLIRQYGRALCEDPRRTEALLRDLCGTYKREINVLVGAVRERVPADLLVGSDTGPKELVLARLTQRLQDNLALTEEAAGWAVVSWAMALGMITSPPVPSPSVVRQPAPTVPSPILSPSPVHRGGGAGMVLVPVGEFIMGTSNDQVEYLVQKWQADRDWLKWEQPQRHIYLDAYFIDAYLVTNAQYREFLKWMQRTRDHSRCHPDEPPSKDHTARFWNNSKWNRPEQPVVGVDWWDAYAYAAWAGKRLPTEAEWEKAARGTDGRLWPWGNEWDCSKCNTANSGPGATTPVGSYPQGVSPYRCYDMAGNLWEWCADRFTEEYYKTGPLQNPTGPKSGAARVLRGGSWASSSRDARCASRVRLAPVFRDDYRGFRCALSPQ